MKNLTLEEVKEKTLELLQSNNNEDVNHITQEMVDKDNESTYEEDGQNEKEVSRVNEIHGHNMRYHYQKGEYGYAYERGSSYTGAGCGNTYSKWLPFSGWIHFKIGDCTSRDAKLKFIRR